MYLQLKDFVDRINVGNLTVYSLLLVFSVLLSLRVEGVICWSYGAVFLPLWVWKFLVAVGTVAGIVGWARKRKRLDNDPESGYHFKALLTSAILQLPLFLTELLVAVNLDTGAHQWRAIFTPFYLLPLLSFPFCLWSCYRKRSLDLELLGMCNLLQVVFLGIRLDHVVQWSWAVVFIPTYLLLLSFLIAVGVHSFYLFLLLPLLSSRRRPPCEQHAQRLADIIKTLSAVGVVITATLFLAMLISRLDGQLSAPYPVIFIPLHLSLLLLLLSTVARQPANPWWFGVHKTFLDLVLDACPPLREYVNVSVVPSDDRSSENIREEGSEGTLKLSQLQVKEREAQRERQDCIISATLYPLDDIFSPD